MEIGTQQIVAVETNAALALREVHVREIEDDLPGRDQLLDLLNELSIAEEGMALFAIGANRSRRGLIEEADHDDDDDRDVAEEGPRARQAVEKPQHGQQR